MLCCNCYGNRCFYERRRNPVALCLPLELGLLLSDSVQLSLHAFSGLLHFVYTREEVVYKFPKKVQDRKKKSRKLFEKR